MSRAAIPLLLLLAGCVEPEVSGELPAGLREAFAQESETFEHRGLCDASAAAWIDAERFVVAGDEDNWLRVYRRSIAEPLALVALDEFLAVDPEHPEADLEAAAPQGDLVYWMTSHGRNKEGKPRPSRRRLFATTGAGDTMEPAAQPYTRLVADLLADERYAVFELEAAARRAPKSPGGLNLEGLVAWTDGALLIGARNPVPDGIALLIPLLEPRMIVQEGGPATFGEPIRLDLDGRGVRALERLGEHGYLIAAGGHAGPADRLYFWSGEPGEEAVRVADPALNVEGLSFDPATGRLLLVSDDGSLLVHGSPCKATRDVADRRFRIQIVDLTALL